MVTVQLDRQYSIINGEDNLAEQVRTIVMKPDRVHQVADN